MDFGCKLAQTASSAVGEAIENMSNAVLDGFEKVVATLGTMWVNVGTPNLTATGSESSSISPGEAAPDTARELTLVLGYVTWISLAIAIISLIALGALISIRMRRGEGAAAVGKVGLILGSVILISAASALVTGLTPAGPTNVGGAALFLQSGLWWYMGAAAVLSVIVGGVRMAWEQRADPGRDTVKSLLTLVVVAGAGVTVIGILISAADAFAVWLINGALNCDVIRDQCFALGLANMLALAPLTGGLGPLLIIILGLVAILASFVQILLMVARGGMLVILAGILPLSASFTNTEMGKQWFRKAVAWTVAFILYKPAAAIVYAAAFQLVGSAGSAPGPNALFTDDGSGLLAALTGLMLMVIALFAMPALLRFVTPMVGSMASAGGGGMAVGALAAVPTGAAAGRLASGSAGGSASPGAAGPQGSSGSGGASSNGSTGAAPSGGGTGGGGTSPPSGGGAAAAGAGGGTGAGVAGGAGAAGSAGATAAGGGAAAAGAGPAGVAVSAAAQAGQAAAGAARSVGEQSTSDEGGPDGSS